MSCFVTEESVETAMRFGFKFPLFRSGYRYYRFYMFLI